MENMNMDGKRYTDGPYVVVPISNQFNRATSYWMSKRGYTKAQYMFSAKTKQDVSEFEKELDKNIKAYEELFEDTCGEKAGRAV